MNINYPHPLEEQLVTAEVSSEQVVVGEEPPLPQQSQFPSPIRLLGSNLVTRVSGGYLHSAGGAHFQGVTTQ